MTEIRGVHIIYTDADGSERHINVGEEGSLRTTTVVPDGYDSITLKVLATDQAAIQVGRAYLDKKLVLKPDVRGEAIALVRREHGISLDEMTDEQVARLATTQFTMFNLALRQLGRAIRARLNGATLSS